MTFQECVLQCAANKELVAEFDRLSGTSLGESRSPLDRLIDEATGREEDEIKEFVKFVFLCIWLPLISGEGDR